MEKKSERAKKTAAGRPKARSKGRETKASDQIAYLGQLIAHVSDALISTDSQFNVLSWNTAAETIYGWKAEEVIGRRVDDFLQTDYAGKTVSEFPARQVQDGKYWKGEVIQSRKDGSRFPVLASVSTIKDDSGQTIGFVAINRDITEQKRMQETLSSSEKYYRTLIEHSSDGIALLDLNGNIKYASPAVTQILGYPIEEYVGHNVFGFIHPEDLPYAQSLFSKLLEKPYQSVLAQIRERHRDGSWRWIEGHAINLLDEPGVEAIVANYRDITERKYTEQELHQSEERYRRIASTVPGVLYDYVLHPDGTGRFLYVGPHAVETLELEPADLLKNPDLFMNMVHPDDIGKLRAEGEMTEPPTQFNTEVRILTPSGVEKWIQLISRHNPASPEDVWSGIMLDVTERKRIEQKLLDSEERFRELADNIEEVFWITESETKKEIYISPAGEKVWGRPIESIDQFIQSVQPEDRARVEASLQKQKQGQKTELEYRIQHADGSTHWIWDRAFPVFDEKGRCVRVAGIAADVTERKHAEEIIGKYATELENRVEERTAELMRANRAKDEFLANMSHELRTPLNGILAFSETLLEGVRGPLTERQSEAIEIINSSGRHLLGLINDILDVSKIEVGKLDFHPELIDASEICEASLMLVREMAAKKSIDLVFDRLPARWMFHGDPQRMKQILVNLLTNSIKFTPSHGRVTVDVHTDGDLNQIKFSITDTGIGISDSDLEKLFNPFFQVDGGLTRQQEGSGLGLALVYKLVNMHGGHVDVKSQLGEGSTFMVTLPWSQNMNIDQQTERGGTNNLSPGQQTSSAESLAASEITRGQRGTILMAEDKETNVMVVRDYLEYRGYQVVIAYNGVEALAKAEQMLPDAILMDVQMPEMDGLEAIRRLRTNPRFSKVPIIAVTALAMPGDRERCLEAGANEYLSKPISLKMLKEMIEKFL